MITIKSVLLGLAAAPALVSATRSGGQNPGPPSWTHNTAGELNLYWVCILSSFGVNVVR